MEQVLHIARNTLDRSFQEQRIRCARKYRWSATSLLAPSFHHHKLIHLYNHLSEHNGMRESVQTKQFSKHEELQGV